MSRDLYWNWRAGVERGLWCFLRGWRSSGVRQSAVGNGGARHILQMVCLTSCPFCGHLLWKMRVLLRREDVAQHPVARSSCLMKIHLGTWKLIKMQAQQHLSREIRKPCLSKEAFRGNITCPPPSVTRCRAAAGDHKLPWAVAMLDLSYLLDRRACMCVCVCRRVRVCDGSTGHSLMPLFFYILGNLQAFGAAVPSAREHGGR